uniref:BHLH domain-containing protein n=1 Tax=Oncorhynchus kisutch TaxID=8019 RepID=A0A8C7KFM7_ONCKI
MVPTITSTMIYSKEHLTLTNKLRKPGVEKLRRDRINNSIEQLKSLLVPEILNQQPDSKLDKADILEMTVSPLKTQSQRRLLSHSQSLQPSSDKNRSEIDSPQLSSPAQHSISKEKSPVNIAPWRPW